jgi:hypothetical protein
MTMVPQAVPGGREQASRTERLVLHAWILAITVALFWVLLS